MLRAKVWILTTAAFLSAAAMAAAQSPQPTTMPADGGSATRAPDTSHATQMPATESPQSPAPNKTPGTGTATPTDSHAQLPANGSAPSFPYEGVVTGDSVFVRSGAGTNWYPTVKLNAGARIRVIGSQSGWLKVVPPQGSFSYVEATAVERSADGAKGTTKTDGVYVLAGSELSHRRSATQQILAKGAEVSILGQEEGFLKIAPPEGSYLYISEQYVKNAADAGALAATQNRTTPESGDGMKRGAATAREGAGLTRTTKTDGGMQRRGAMAQTPVRTEPAQPSKYRIMLDAAEAELNAMRTTSQPTEGFGKLLERYGEIAAQKDDLVAQAVAKTRIDQLQARAELEKILTDARIQTDSVDVFRSKLGQDRERIANTKLPPELRAWDFRGELRRSLAFNQRGDRYRLYDPVTRNTLAYVDIPPALGIDSGRYVNRYVGIRASGQYFSTSARVPIVVAAELDLLTPVQAPTPIPTVNPSGEMPAADSAPKHDSGNEKKPGGDASSNAAPSGDESSNGNGTTTPEEQPKEGNSSPAPASESQPK